MEHPSELAGQTHRCRKSAGRVFPCDPLDLFQQPPTERVCCRKILMVRCISSCADGRWFLKISDVDYGCGILCFETPLTSVQLEGKLAELQQEALRRLTELRKAKGCKPREIGGEVWGAGCYMGMIGNDYHICSAEKDLVNGSCETFAMLPSDLSKSPVTSF